MSNNKKRKLVNFDQENEVKSFESQVEDFLTKKNIVEKDSWEEVIYDIIRDLEKKTSTYFDADEIIKDFKESIIRNQEGIMNRCLECGIDMGKSNPRQLCGKTYCYSS